MNTVRERSAPEDDWRAGRWTPDLVERAWLAAEGHPDTRSITLAVEVQHALLGLDPDALERASALAARRGPEAASLALRLVSAGIANGARRPALERLDAFLDDIESTRFGPARARRRLAVARAAARLPRLLASWSSERPERLPRTCRALANEARELLARERPIADLLNAPELPADAPVAVVGNAPSLLGAGRGGEIEAAGHVVRFNAAVTGEALAADLGRRTDTHVLSPGAVRRDTRLAARQAIVTGIDPLSRPSRYWRHLAACRPARLGFFPDTLWHALVAELHAPPSAGLLTLAWYARLAGERRVDPHGFGLLEPATSACAPNHYADAEPRSTRHDWDAERRLLAGLASSRPQELSPKSS